MAMGDRKRGFERIEEEAKSLKWRTKLFKEKNEFRTGENGVRNFRIPVILQDREHGFENWRKKRIRTRFAQGSHSYEIRTGDREHVIFEKWCKNGIRTG